MQTEFEFINKIKAKYGLANVGDDSAVLPKDDATDLVVTADMLVEDIDFRLEWTKPEFLGHKALAVSLSDVAAMGASPTWAMLSLAVPENLWKTDFLDRFYAGWHELAGKHAIELAGGDISRSPDKLVIDSIVGGEVAKGKAIRRSGAQPGEAIFVTGFLGGAAAGLELLMQSVKISGKTSTTARHLLNRQLQPIPQVITGKLLQEYALPSATIDLSDGLSSDLSHIVKASGVGARINGDAIPIDPAINDFLEFSETALDLPLNGGEDFELLFTTGPERIPIAMDLGFHWIGEIVEGPGTIELTIDDRTEIIEPRGYRHF